ncbi:fungal-specific transcription factor domain-containing protein [Microdochium trichocladiopsis]|uniref:Fungal-specific transcription factor domain-containing protein n=1 Tax=Microdochium trichocladiopsis TaxID=1682393 RepID=A0A9P8YIW1_9PEZI|nr:fungal-specific transcription factor domain-containing protein [Microdochium trichocladiopsis]KAH7041075.1 fungal-specific transcription factor domain-containing protein [Microdochium trichocladiopsis]
MAAESDEASQDGQHPFDDQIDDQTMDAFSMPNSGENDGVELGGRRKMTSKDDAAPAWSELKTKAGKERKRLPLACASCRRKKIRCSGEKPACKHCIRSRLPCVYKVTTRKAAPRTDYMAMLDKRLRRMEDRIIKTLPKSEQEASANAVIRAVVKPSLPGTLKQGVKKRKAEEAFAPDFNKWARSASGSNDVNRSVALKVQEEEESKLLAEGRDALPSQELQEHLAEVYFEVVYGQAYHLLHKPSYMRKLRAGTLPPVLILSVCAVSARFSQHTFFSNTVHFLRGEDWASSAREIVKRRYDWPNITILTCYLILALHEFGTCQGGRSWMLGGDAIRMAFALQLHRDLEHDPQGPKSNTPLSFVDREIRRRTMWASFLMDRFTSSGIDRPMFVKEEDVRIQLPIKEKLFQLDMPGPTEDLHGRTPHPVPSDAGQLADPQENMGVAAYMIRSIALWGRIISYLNQGGKKDDSHHMWESSSRYTELLSQAEDLPRKLPLELQYTRENLHLHNTERMANQFLFLHITIQQNILFLNRFAVSSPTGSSQTNAPKDFVTRAGAQAFAAANRMSEVLKDAERHLVSAPFVGYCAFLSGTVHIFGIFSGNAALEHAAKQHLATNIRFLSRMKRYWGMFHFMLENLREQYRTCMDAASRGAPPTDSTTTSPVFQYGDWFSRYPHGVSASDFVDPAAAKQRESGDDGVLEQKPELHTVEEYMTQLSPAQSHDNKEPGPGTGPNKRKASTKAVLAGVDGQVLAIKSSGHGAQALRQQVPKTNTSLHPTQRQAGRESMQAQAPGQLPVGFSGLSPISPVEQASVPPLLQQHSGGHIYTSQDLLALPMSNAPSAILPQLDRQLVFNAYGDLDPRAMADPDEIDWHALAGTSSNGNDPAAVHDSMPTPRVNANTIPPHPHSSSMAPPSFAPETSSAWFMPFNLDPANFAHDLAAAGGEMGGSGAFDNFGGIFPSGEASIENLNDPLDLQHTHMSGM